MGTAHLPAFSLRFCLIELDSTLACDMPSRSSRYAGTASLSAGASAALCLFSRSSCALMVFFISAFSAYRFLFSCFALMPRTFLAIALCLCPLRASFFRSRSAWSKRLPCRFWCSSM